MINYEVNINTLLELKLGFEAYFVLYCLYNKDNKLITSYTRECKKINTEIFLQLAKEGYLLMNNNSNTITFESLSLTEKGSLLFNSHTQNSLGTVLFEQFKNNYPSSAKGGRRLHGNLSRCRKLYNEITKEVPHEILCKCARLYILEKKRTNSEEYIQLLVTWLHQKNYEQYLNDDEQDVSEERTNYDVI